MVSLRAAIAFFFLNRGAKLQMTLRLGGSRKVVLSKYLSASGCDDHYITISGVRHGM
jgi:hypothetical protein